MPEMRFVVRWPDGAEEACYSPSFVIKDYFTPGESYALADFVERSRTALLIASDRVRAKYGFLQRTADAGGGPIDDQPQIVFLAEAIARQHRAGWAAIGVPVRQIDELSLAEAPRRLGIGGVGPRLSRKPPVARSRSVQREMGLAGATHPQDAGAPTTSLERDEITSAHILHF
jgi:uncharacterized repeat protein (TIGR04042 family)